MTRPRRFDPHRKERIVEAALEVLAEHGLAGTTHRSVAAAADVPLGSVTYHFASLQDLVRQAFTRHAATMAERYAAAVAAAEDVDELVEALVDVVCGGSSTQWCVAYELYLAALRDPALREVTQGWMQASRAALRAHVDAETARSVDALVEGLAMHRLLATRPAPRADVRRAVRRQLGVEPSA